MRRFMIAGNWKMHGTRAVNRGLMQAIVETLDMEMLLDVAVFPPYVHLIDVLEIARGTKVLVGAQNSSSEPCGAMTGEVAVSMLADLGCRLVLVGHSERRQILGESDSTVAKKFMAVQAEGLQPVLCVGETLAERDAGQTEPVVRRQLDAVLEMSGPDSLANAIIAYEPVWAIGTGRTATPDQAQAVHAFLRGCVASHNDMIASQLRILYGGSVKASNAAELFAQEDVDGGLVGGASLNADEFARIISAAAAQ